MTVGLQGPAWRSTTPSRNRACDSRVPLPSTRRGVSRFDSVEDIGNSLAPVNRDEVFAAPLVVLPGQPEGVPWPTPSWPTGTAGGDGVERLLDDAFDTSGPHSMPNTIPSPRTFLTTEVSCSRIRPRKKICEMAWACSSTSVVSNSSKVASTAAQEIGFFFPSREILA